MNITDLDADQLDAAAEIAAHNEAFCLLPLGFGKTVVMLTAFEWMRQYTGGIRSMVVVSTKAIVEKTWPEEIEKWDHLRHLSYFAPVGRARWGDQRPDVLGINFNNLLWYLDVLDEHPELTPDVIVFDESDAMKNMNTKRVSRFAGVRRRGDTADRVVGYVHRFKRRFAMTATPNPEDYMDLFGQEACISTRRRMGLNITMAREQYCHSIANDFGSRYEVTPNGERRIEQALEPITIVSPRADYLGDLPAPEEIEVDIPWTAGALEEYEQMEQLFEVRFGVSLEQAMLDLEDEDVDVDPDVEGENKGAVLNKLRQMCSGFIFNNERDAIALADSNAKIDALLGLMDKRSPLVITVQYNPTREHIARALDAEGYTFSVGLPDDLDAWSSGEYHAMIIHPRSAGAGVNLQYGSHRMVHYELPWGSRDYTQANGRIHRRGQTRQCQIYRFMRPASIEHYVWAKIQRKLGRQNRFINNIRALKGYTQ